MCEYDEDNYQDYCDHTCTSHDYEDAGCSHKDFTNPVKVPPIKSLEHYKSPVISVCCDTHSYIFFDNCEVNSYRKYFIGDFYQEQDKIDFYLIGLMIMQLTLEILDQTYQPNKSLRSS